MKKSRFVVPVWDRRDEDRIVVVEKWRRFVAEAVAANLPKRPSRDDILDIVCKVLRDHGA
ncbi:MAG: hypothetical protein ABID40_03130 [Candidatus Bipolaricaulota bacterium]